MALLLSLTVSLRLLSLVSANPLAAPQPLITEAPRVLVPRQDASSIGGDWIGYYQYTESSDSSIDSSWTAQSCGSGSTFFTTNSAVGCCGTSGSAWLSDCMSTLKTGCGSQSIVSYAGTSSDCGTGMICIPDTIYTSSTADPNGLLWYGCMSRQPRFFFQALPDTANPITSDDSSSTGSPTSSTASPGSTSTSAVSQTSSPTGSESPAPTKKKESKAWIAGVVVGAVALIGIAVGAFFFLARRKKNKEQSYQPAPQMQQGYPPQYPQSPYMGTVGYASPPQEHPMSPNPAPAGVGVHEQKGYYGQDVQGQPGGVAAYPQYGQAGGAAPMSHNAGPVQELPALSDPPANATRS